MHITICLAAHHRQRGWLIAGKPPHSGLFHMWSFMLISCIHVPKSRAAHPLLCALQTVFRVNHNYDRMSILAAVSSYHYRL